MKNLKDYIHNIQQTDTSQPESRQKLDRSFYPPEIWNTLDPQPNQFGAGQLLGIKRKKSVLKVLNYFLVISKYFKHLYPSQSGNIELKTGLENETICRAIKWLCQKGYLAKKGRGANKSCEYKVSSWFNDPWVQEQLKSILQVFYFTAISLISIQSLEKKLIKRSINDYYFIKKQQQQTSTVYTTTGRKKEYQKRILKKKGRTMLEEIKSALNLGEYETSQLSNFNEVVLKEGWIVLNKNKDVKNKFRYLIGICNNITAKQQTGSAKGYDKNAGNPSTEKQIAPYKPKRIPDWERINTAAAIANEIAKIKAIDASVMIGGEEYQQRMLTNWAHKEYKLTGQEGEQIAILYIEEARKQYNFLKPAEIKPQSNTISDSSIGQHINHIDKNLSTNSNVVRVDNTDIDYNLMEEDFSNLELS